MKKLSLFILFSAAQYLFASDISDAGAYLRENVKAVTLDNGIRLIMLDRGYSPTLAFEISFRVGSADESYNTAGAAHMLEHMLFKGTDTIGTLNFKKEAPLLREIERTGEELDYLRLVSPGTDKTRALEEKLKILQNLASQYVISSAYDRIYTSAGGVGFNASTSSDRTGYYIELPASEIETWAEVESGRLKNPVLREFYTERDNVIQERLMRYEAGGFPALYEAFLAAAFTAHPYRHPVIGWGSGIPFLSIKEIKRFYHDYYTPSGMVITIVGRQNTAETEAVVRKYFGSLEGRARKAPTSLREPARTGEKRFELNLESSEHLMIGWHKPAPPSADDYILDVTAEIFAGGRASRLYRTLVMEKKAAVSINCWNGVPGNRFDNLFVISAAPSAGTDPRKLEEMIYGEMAQALSGLSDEDILKVVNKIESSMIFGLDSNSGLARLLSYYETVLGGWSYVSGYLDRIKTVTPGEIRAAAGKYLTRSNRTVGILRDSRSGGSSE